MKANKALYISKSKSIHDERFVEAFSEVTSLDEIYLDETGPLFESGIFDQRDLIIASPLTTGLSSIPSTTNARIFGICMAYEINEDSKDSIVSQEISRNVQRCTAIICDCRQIQKELTNRFNFKGPILNIAYGCNQQDFLDIEFKNQEVLRIISTRSWTQIHSNETSLQALELAKHHGLKFKVRYFGAEILLTEEIKSKYIEKFENDVSFLGLYSQADLPTIMSQSEVYVSTSLSDGTSVSLLEAMSAGRICVVRDFPSNREWINHGINGFLFTSIKDLSEVLISISNLSFQDKLQISNEAKLSVKLRGDWIEMRKTLIEFAKRWIIK